MCAKNQCLCNNKYCKKYKKNESKSLILYEDEKAVHGCNLCHVKRCKFSLVKHCL